MGRISMFNKLQYAFDNAMSKGSITIIKWLGIISVFLILSISFFVWIAAIAPDKNFIELIWMSLLRTLDAGTMGGDTGTWPFLISMLVVTFLGIFVISTFIGLITTGIGSRLETLQKGKSKVIEAGHAVVLGWSEQVFAIISELIEANRSKKKACIVIMSNKDKMEMEDEIRHRVKEFGTTRIVCRQGNPTFFKDLEIVNLDAAHSIIILASDKDKTDSNAIKTILAITNAPNRDKDKIYYIVAEIQDRKNAHVIKESVAISGRDEVELVVIGDKISQIIAQTCRQSGLSAVYAELFSFSGNEIYIKNQPELNNKIFSDILMAYEECSVIGLHQKGMSPKLLPSLNTYIQDGDKIIVIAEDDANIFVSTDNNNYSEKINKNAIHLLEPARPTTEQTLILGWNEKAYPIIKELDKYVAPGSKVTVVATFEKDEKVINELCSSLKNQKVTLICGDTTDYDFLKKLNIEEYNHVIVLPYFDVPDIQKADTKTIITLLHLRKIADSTNQSYQFSVVSEMLDIRNRDLAEVTHPDDFIVSNKLIAQILAQVSEDKELNAVFEDLLNPEGAEVYFKLAENYVALNQKVNFYTVVEAVKRRNEIAIGYRKYSEVQTPPKYGVYINPKKSEEIIFEKWDRIITLSEKE